MILQTAIFHEMLPYFHAELIHLIPICKIQLLNKNQACNLMSKVTIPTL